MNTLKYLIFLNLLLFPKLGFSFPILQIQNELIQLRASGKTPIAVFDLDETLIHSAKRKTYSFIKAIERNQAVLSAQWPSETRMAYEKFTYSGETIIRSLANQYDSIQLGRKLGIPSIAFMQKLNDLALPIYLSNEFIYLDSGYQGALQLLELIYQQHGKVYFVTSRFKDAQYGETIKNLTHLNLARTNGQTTLVLRNDGEASIGFKKRVFSQIQATKRPNEMVTLVAENEPENLNAMIAQFPQAIAVFVQGAVLNQAVPLKVSSRIIFTKNFVRD